MYDEILSSIDNIDDCVMEAELNVINAMYDHCQKAYMIYENCDDIGYSSFDIFYESASNNTNNNKGIGSKIKSITHKIWVTIKKIFSFIGKQLMKIVNFIKRIFTGKKKSGTADQAAIEAGLKGNKNVTPGTKRTVKITFETNEPANVMSEASDLLTTNDASEYTSTVKRNISTDIVVEAKEFSILFTQGNNIEFVYAGDMWGENHKLKIPSQNNKDIRDWYKITSVCLLADDNMLKEFKNVISELLNCMSKTNPNIDTGNVVKKFNEFQNKLFTYQKDVYKNLNMSYKISADQLINFQKVISELIDNMDKFAISDIQTTPSNQDLIRALQTSLNIIRNTQTGLNAMSGALRDYYEIDDRFVHTVNDPEVLDTFVNAMIENGIPPKYIAYNAWLVCDKNIVDTSKYIPIWGQSRIIFFPNDKPNSVYKVALSKLGTSANKSEMFIYNSVSKIGLSNLFAKPNKLYSKASVLDMDRCYTSYTLNPEVAERFEKTIHEEIGNNKLPFIIGDLHPGNFGISNDNKWVVIDYGSINKIR